MVRRVTRAMLQERYIISWIHGKGHCLTHLRVNLEVKPKAVAVFSKKKKETLLKVKKKKKKKVNQKLLQLVSTSLIFELIRLEKHHNDIFTLSKIIQTKLLQNSILSGLCWFLTTAVVFCGFLVNFYYFTCVFVGSFVFFCCLLSYFFDAVFRPSNRFSNFNITALFLFLRERKKKKKIIIIIITTIIF